MKNKPALQAGQWTQEKFWGRFADFGNPTGGHKAYDTDKKLELIPLGSFLLNFIANDGRGTFGVWNFDPAPNNPCSADPIPNPYPYTAQGAFRDIQTGHELLPFNNYVLDREVATGKYRVWSFDPQARSSKLGQPTLREGSSEAPWRPSAIPSPKNAEVHPNFSTPGVEYVTPWSNEVLFGASE